MRQVFVLVSPDELERYDALIAQLRKDVDMANEAVANVIREVAELRPVVDNVVAQLQAYAQQLEGVRAELAALQIDNTALNDAAQGLDSLAAGLAAALPPLPPEPPAAS